ncbi:MAG: hypothetical protein HUU10_08505 [Bacteroidetes bacterium]|nr:hypothetical protein [Bacteroidota bacterium]
MDQPPKVDPSVEKEFLQIVKEKYGGNLELAVNRAFQLFVMIEKQTDGMKIMMDKISAIRSQITDLNSEAAKALQDINEIKKRAKET